MTRHPFAADTCEGIARWWSSRQLAMSPETVQRALDALVRAGRLQVRRLPSGELWYHAAP